MGQVLEAVFEKGSFTPVEAVELPEGQRVSLSVEPLAMTQAEADAYLRDWRKLFEGFSEQEVADLEAVILDRSRFSRHTEGETDHFARVDGLRLDSWTAP